MMRLRFLLTLAALWLATLGSAQVFNFGHLRPLDVPEYGSTYVADTIEVPGGDRYMVAVVPHDRRSKLVIYRLSASGEVKTVSQLEGYPNRAQIIYRNNFVFVLFSYGVAGSPDVIYRFRRDLDPASMITVHPRGNVYALVDTPRGLVASGSARYKVDKFRPEVSLWNDKLKKIESHLIDNPTGDSFGSSAEIRADLDGNVYVRGYYFSGETFLWYLSHDGLASSYQPTDYLTPTKKTYSSFRSFAVDPTTGMAMVQMAQYDSVTKKYFPYYATLKVVYSPGSEFDTRSSMDTFDFTVQDSDFVGGNGQFAWVGFRGTNQNPVHVVACWKEKDDLSGIEPLWEATVPLSSRSTFSRLFKTPGGGYLYREWEGPITSFSENGLPLQHTVLPVPTQLFEMWSSGDRLFCLGPRLSDNGTYSYYVNFSGPDDYYYLGLGSNTISVDSKSGVLKNDAPGVPPTVLSADLRSILVGLDSVTVNSDGSFTATKTPGFSGIAKFRYNIYHNQAAAGNAIASIDCSQPGPVAQSDTFAVVPNSGEVLLDVLANDESAATPIKIDFKTRALNATVNYTTDHLMLKFKPKKDYVGDVTFTYTIRDEMGMTSTASVTVHVAE